VNDSVYSIDVTVIKRVRNVPRDRRRDVFLNNVGALDKEIQLVHAALDWQYTVLYAANMLLAADADAPSMVGFCEPLRMTSVQRRPRLVNPDMFGAGQTQAAGMARTITFGGARRVSAIQR
jgi:hypothetical protein